MEKQRKTFLSYSSANKGFAIRLAQELKAEGFNIWLDQLDIPAGARWDREVERALRESEIFMIILTPASVDSENVLDEIGYAIDKKKRFLPVLLEECEVPLRLRRFQYVDFTNKNFDEGVKSAKALLRSLVEQPTTPHADAAAVRDGLAENARRAREESERLAAQKAEEERLAKEKADAERRAKADAKRKATEEAERLARQNAEPKPVTNNVSGAPPFVPVTAAHVAASQPQSKSGYRAMLLGAFGLFAVIGTVALVVVLMVIRGLYGNNNAYEPPITEAPIYFDSATETSTATEEPATATPAPTQDPSIIFQSDFSDPENTGWGTYDCCYVEDGTFVMVMKDDTESWVSGPKIDFSQYGADVAVQASVTFVPNSSAGVYCRRQSNEALYLFLVVFDNSSAQIWYYDGGSGWNNLAEQSVTISDTDNSFYAVCQRDSLAFYWNGKLTAEATDGTLPDAGEAGLYTATTNSSGATIVFDDFNLTYP